MDDFVNAIAYEVKLEIANRYFGFRTQIEAEIKQYLERLHQTEKEHLFLLQLDIRRMEILLQRKELFMEFLQVAGLPQQFSGSGADRQYPPDTVELFAGLTGEGFSRWRRYRDLGFKVYRTLESSIAAYRNTYLDLEEEYGELCARIDEFQRNNDLTGILCFLRTFDSPDNERLKFLHSELLPRPGKTLDQELNIPHPRPLSDTLPDLAVIPPLKQIKNRLNTLLKSAYSCYIPGKNALPL